MFSVLMDYLSEDEELAVARQSTGAIVPVLRQVTTARDLLGFAAAIRQVALPAPLAQYIVTLVDSSRPTRADSPDFIREYVTWGAGLRASQNIALGAKALAAMSGRPEVAAADVRRTLQPVLRHRLGLSFKADVDRVTVTDLISRLAGVVPEP
jgi:MoxR-like ATPase